MKFEVKSNKEFRKQFFPIVGTLVGVAYPLFISATIIAFFSILEGDMGDIVILLMVMVGIILLTPQVVKELHKGFDKYEFEENCFTVKKFYGKSKKYTIEEITRCQFYPQCTAYRGMYSDAVLFAINNNLRKPIIIFRDYHENFAMVRKWILENDIKVEVHDNPLGENHPKYIKFINKEI